MGLGSEVEERVDDYLDGDYEVQETTTIPEPKDVPLGKVAKKLSIVAYAIDLRDSTGLLEVHQKQTAGKIHKAFLYAASRSVINYGGLIRNFRGDGLLALWPEGKDGCAKAVRSAMTTKWLLDVKLKNKFAKYRELDFGIGIDVDDAFIIRAGTSKDANTNDLVFISPAVNFAVSVADKARGPNHVEICGEVYKRLPESLIFGTNPLGLRVDMWSNSSIQWQGRSHSTKKTEGWISHND